VNQILLPRHEPVPSITEIPGYLVHPDPIRLGCDAGDRNSPADRVFGHYRMARVIPASPRFRLMPS
jgi:hypothetical protein